MIELSAPAVLRETKPEHFVVAGFSCPECNGNGWGWRQDDGNPDADRRGWVKAACPTCGGTGEVDAEVTVRWKKQKQKGGIGIDFIIKE